MPYNIFVSYASADKFYAKKIQKWSKRGKIGTYPVAFSSSEDEGVRTKKGRVIKPKLEKKIKEADFIIVIIGKNNQEHPWQRYEDFAVEHNITRYYTRIPYTDGELPEKLNHLQQIAFNPNAFEKLLRLKEEGIASPVMVQNKKNKLNKQENSEVEE